MVRGFPMNLLHLLLLLTLVLGAPVTEVQSATTRQLVLVAAADSPIPPLTTSEIRHIYLGFPLEKAGLRITPLRNQSDGLLYEVFLQKILFMSAQRYERQLLSQSFRSGTRRPESYKNWDTLLAELHATAGCVSFAWLHSVQDHNDLRVVQVLWQSESE